MDATVDHAEGEQFWVQIRGKAYGPYCAEQMRQFLIEGRIRAKTLTSTVETGPWREARAFETLASTLNERAFAKAPEGESGAPEGANLVVFAELQSLGADHFRAGLASLGLFVDIAPGVWLLRTRTSVGAVRNRLSQTLQRGDRFVVVDATRDRLAWFNLGPEVDARIREVWNRALSTGVLERAR